MSSTFNFEELDQTTHDYLVAVRDCEGLGAPGVFVATSDPLPLWGIILGPVVIILTLVLTLSTWVNVIYDDPLRVAVLQTGGLVLGVWLLAAGFRNRQGSSRIAGTWVYVDPLFLYEAYREQITVTEIEEVVDARFDHHHDSNGNYQNSTIRISMGGSRSVMVKVKNAVRAEQIAVFLNYLAYSRGPKGGERANLAPATLGGLAKYVVKHNDEPLDAESKLNLNLIELDITEVPEEPTRQGRAMPSILPYICLLAFAVLCFFLLGYVVNPPLRDDAHFANSTRVPLEPRMLRVYLAVPGVSAHREEVLKKLSAFYQDPIDHVREKGTDEDLREGMAKLLDSLRTAELPVVSVRVTEKNTPPGKEGSRGTRESDLRTQLTTGITTEFSKTTWGQPVTAPPGMEFAEPPPPRGQQFIMFIEPPEGADKVHIDITYTLEPGGAAGQYQMAVVVEIRTSITQNPVARSEFVIPGTFDGSGLDNQIENVKYELVARMVGLTKPPVQPQPF